MARLYEIDAAIENCVDPETGEVIDEEALNALLIEKDEKINGIAEWYLNLCSDAEQYKQEKDKFAQRQRVCENKAKVLKQYLETYLHGEKFKSTTVTISYRKSNSVEVDDVSKLDSRFLKVVNPEADKTAIKDYLKSIGATSMEGAHIVEKNNINIR